VDARRGVPHGRQCLIAGVWRFAVRPLAIQLGGQPLVTQPVTEAWDIQRDRRRHRRSSPHGYRRCDRRGLRASASSYDPGEHIISTSTSGSLTPRVDFELRPPAPPSVNYAGVWSGAYTITDCRDLDVPGLNQLHLCPFRTQSYQFTLTQNGTLVSGTYKLWSSFYNCGCGVLGYGDFLMSGAVSPDGSLAVTAVGSVRATGVTGELDLTLRQSSPSTITGTGTLHLRFNTPDDRSIGSVVIQSGTRAP